MWSGGIVGLKSILGVKRRQKALWIMHELENLGYLEFTHDLKSKQITYKINDWVHSCGGAECEQGTVYVTNGYGFLAMPRTITERLTANNRIFDEAEHGWISGVTRFKGLRQCVFFFGTCYSVWKIRVWRNLASPGVKRMSLSCIGFQ